MVKTLTISIAAYNAAQYIRQTLDSCLAEEVLDDLEIMVIDDGGTDETAEIARYYEQRYPGTVHFVHKENGGYGTTVNTSMALATGKYFRLLDGDDWFDQNGLIKLVRYLKQCSADMVLTKMNCVYPDREVLADDTWKQFAGMETELSAFPKGAFAGMWEVTFLTEILHQHPFELPAHTLYTDHIFVMKTIPYIKTVACMDFPLYCYRLGNDGQSVSVGSRKKHVDEKIKVARILCKYYHDKCRGIPNQEFALERAKICYLESFKDLLLLSCNYKNYQKMKQWDLELKNIDVEIYHGVKSGRKAVNLFRKAGFVGYLLLKIRNHNRYN